MKKLALSITLIALAGTLAQAQNLPINATAELTLVHRTLSAALGVGATATPCTPLPPGTLLPAGSPVPLCWTPSVSCAITGVTCYATVYRSLANCATVPACTWTPLTTAASPAPTAGPYTDSTVPTTATVASYYVTNTATGNGWTNAESGASNITTANFQQAPPAPPTGLNASTTASAANMIQIKEKPCLTCVAMMNDMSARLQPADQ